MPWSHIKDETIKSLKQNYLMLLLMSVIVTIATSFIAGILSGALSLVQLLVTLPFSFMVAAESEILVILGTIGTSLVSVVFGVLMGGVTYLVSGIVMVAVAKTLSNAKQTGVINLYDLLYPFQSNLVNILKVELRKSIEITLWTLLCIVPGIIKFYEYFMVDFLLAENPNMDAKEALATSKSVTTGEKLGIFGITLLSSFIVGLGVIACCIGQFALMPIPYIVQFEVFLYLKSKMGGFSGPTMQDTSMNMGTFTQPENSMAQPFVQPTMETQNVVNEQPVVQPQNFDYGYAQPQTQPVQATNMFAQPVVEQTPFVGDTTQSYTAETQGFANVNNYAMPQDFSNQTLNFGNVSENPNQNNF